MEKQQSKHIYIVILHHTLYNLNTSMVCWMCFIHIVCYITWQVATNKPLPGQYFPISVQGQITPVYNPVPNVFQSLQFFLECPKISESNTQPSLMITWLWYDVSSHHRTDFSFRC